METLLINVLMIYTENYVGWKSSGNYFFSYRILIHNETPVTSSDQVKSIFKI